MKKVFWPVAAAVAALGLAGLPGVPAAAASTNPGPGPLTRARELAPTPAPRGASDQGAEAARTPVHLEIALAPSNPSGMASYIAGQYDKSSPLYHHWLTPGHFDALFAPSPSTVSSVRSWLSSRGLNSQRSSAFALTVTTTASQVATALGTPLERYTAKGRDGYAARQAPLVPANLHGDVSGILGLDTFETMSPDYSHLHPRRTAASPRAVVHSASVPTDCTAATDAAAGGGYTMADEGADYGLDTLLNAGLTGSGQKIGLFELASYDTSDITWYEQCFGLGNHVSAVNVDGGSQLDFQGGGTGEADIDIQEAITQAPGASVIAYDAPNDGNPGTIYDLWNQIVSSDATQSVSTSWGICEPDAVIQSSLTTLFAEAAAQGQSVFSASGDSGSEDCAGDAYQNPVPTQTTKLEVDYPASDPYVTAVGGTDVPGSGSPNVAADYTAWNYCDGYPYTDTNYTPPNGLPSGVPCWDYYSTYAAGGGGESTHFTSASWQRSYLSATGQGTSCSPSPCREVPDVSADAGYPLVGYVSPNAGAPYSASNWGAGIGTSFAAPFMAGLAADRNSGCTQSAGNFASLLYGLGRVDNASFGQIFLDVTAGNTDMFGNNGGKWAARTGYDMATGLGTPNPIAITCPEIQTVSTTHAAPGSTMTIGGFGLENADFYFGGALATVSSATPTSATVVVPQGSGTVNIVGALNGVAGTHVFNGFTFDAGGTNPGPTCANASGEILRGAVGIASVNINGCKGYFVADAQGRVAAFGSATTHGDLTGIHLAKPVIAIVATPDEEGYWMLGADGGIFNFGDARYWGSTGNVRLNAPVVGMAPTTTNRGYWLVAKDGGIFTFGDAHFYGSTGNVKLAAPVVGIAVAPGGSGYWLVASDGGVFTFTNPYRFYGSLGKVPLNKPVIGMSSTPDGKGYTLVGADGGVFNFGDAPFYGSLGKNPPPSPIVDLSPTPKDDGYYLVTAAGAVYAFGPGARSFGSV
jgi:hypothetical protein